MQRPWTAPRTTRSILRGAVALVATLAVSLSTGTAEAPAGAATAARAGNVVTPGDFTGYGFDQCLAPSQRDMTTWLQHSPFLAVGIYISGKSRACRSQPNLTPTWVSRQLADGWRLLPITLGPQASCQPRFPRYGDDPTINPKPGRYGKYSLARNQGTAEAGTTVDAAQALGIAPGSTLWYDLEGFDLGNTNCRESALVFLSAWTTRIHALGYVSGVYSSAGSGIAMLDDARVKRPGQFDLPDAIWMARWDGAANTSTSYVREDGWQPHARVKQYQGGHDEQWGRAKINIDRDYLDLGKGSYADPETHCGGVHLAFYQYEVLKPGTTLTTKVKALQCLLTEQGTYAGKVDGVYSKAVLAAVHQWQSAHGFTVSDRWTKSHWMSLLAAGPQPVVKYGSAGPAVRRVQRALDAADPTARVKASGVFDASTTVAVKAWQQKVGVEVNGVLAPESWAALTSGLR
ncbi:MAG: glycoside hydrolase domain-containing protein [Nocardioides sp.]